MAARSLREADYAAAAGMASYCERRLDADPCAHRDGKDPRRIFVVHRQIDAATGAV